MEIAREMTYNGAETLPGFKRLATPLRRTAAERKYSAAVALYASTRMTVRSVAEQCGVTPAALSAHIARHHRQLLFQRYGLSDDDHSLLNVRVKPPKGQSLSAHIKYKEAIEAAGDIAYIEFNMSQIARMFGLNPTALSSQLKVHYPDVIPARERLRRKLGIAGNTHRGQRRESVEAYSVALSLYRDTDLSLPEVAEQCGVSRSGLCQFMRFYHKDVISLKAKRRSESRKKEGMRKPGALAGNGSTYGPEPRCVELYSESVELYRTTSLTVEQIAARTGVPAGGLRSHLRQWHRQEDSTGRRLRVTAAKYAPAIESLRQNPRPVSEVAAEFGLHPEVFRSYLKSHEPELASRGGMVRDSGGRLVKRSSAEKYAGAIREYAETAEPLKSIALRHGIPYPSLTGFILRNCPEERERHRRLVDESSAGGSTE